MPITRMPPPNLPKHNAIEAERKATEDNLALIKSESTLLRMGVHNEPPMAITHEQASLGREASIDLKNLGHELMLAEIRTEMAQRDALAEHEGRERRITPEEMRQLDAVALEKNTKFFAEERERTERRTEILGEDGSVYQPVSREEQITAILARRGLPKDFKL